MSLDHYRNNTRNVNGRIYYFKDDFDIAIDKLFRDYEKRIKKENRKEKLEKIMKINDIS